LFSTNNRELGHEIARILVEVVPLMDVETLQELVNKSGIFVASRPKVTKSELLVEEFGAAITQRLAGEGVLDNTVSAE
jgi:hypothetical protein